MTTDIRVLNTEDQLVAAANLFRTAMIGLPPMPAPRPGQIRTLHEPGRTIGAFVGDELVGTADAVAGGLTLPGGAVVRHAAVTDVGVSPSFTRRGIATELVQHQLRDIAARGEAVASLRASEATIYERYGYGVASSTQSIEVLTARAALRPDVGTGGPVRLVDAADAWDVLPRICSAHRPARPGTVDRSPMWWRALRLRSQSSPEPSYIAVHGKPGAETGFARYRPVDTGNWFVSDQRTIAVEDFFAPTAQAYLGLLRFLLGLDLIDRIVFWMLPVDDPLPLLLRDRRAAKVAAVFDETWLRIVDVGATLGARHYAAADSVAVSVTDPLLENNSATFVITADGAQPTDRRPDLHIDVTALATVLLGGTTWRSQALAGRVRADDPAALAAADRLFAVDTAPHCGFFF
ncbi:GNAT family N-acetyltransferase [Mycobacterium sp.]|uniref:GNAT family N-acetyltransferase n=1 Tax=Mycobacterium sp. TaxID=1785 RepID=UPI003A8541C4